MSRQLWAMAAQASVSRAEWSGVVESFEFDFVPRHVAEQVFNVAGEGA